MAIEAIEGTLGAGKTLYVATRIAEHLSRGGVVYTNVSIEFMPWKIGKGGSSYKEGLGMRHFVMERYGKIPVAEQLIILQPNEVTDFQKLVKWGHDEMHVLLALDEIHLFYDQYTAKEFNKRLMDFLTQTRKASIDIIFISQDIQNVAVQFRRLIQYRWTFRDMGTYLLPGWGALITGRILGVCFDKNARDIMKRVWIKKEPIIYGSYRSKAIVNDMAIADCVPLFVLEDVPKKKFAERDPREIWKAGLAVAAGFMIAAKLAYLTL